MSALATGWDADALTLLAGRLPADPPTEDEAAIIASGLGAAILPASADLDRLARSVRGQHPECVLATAGRGGEALPTARALGEIDDVDLSRDLGEAAGDVLAACDIDLALAGLLDVATAADPWIGTRAFGDHPDLVTRHARAVTGGIREAGVAVCGTHFPGMGSLPDDGTTTLPPTRSELESEHLGPWDLVPWLDAVMTAPVQVPALGEGPAPLAAWAAPLLDRIGHSGYHGLLLAGRLDRAAALAGCDLGEAAVRALEAGAHLLDLGEDTATSLPERVGLAHDAILAALGSGRLDGTALRDHAELTRSRVRALRARRRWLPTPDLDGARARLEEIGAEAARRAVRVRRIALDLRPAAVIDVRAGGTGTAGEGREAMVTALRDHGIAADHRTYEYDALAAPQLLVLTRRPRTDPEEEARLHRVLAARGDAIVVHTGPPGAAPEIEHLVLAHGQGRALMRASVQALLAEGR